MATTSKSDKQYRNDVRETAVTTLLRWESGEASLDDLAEEALLRLPEKNRPFYTEVVRGTVRRLLSLDYIVGKLTNRSPGKLDPSVRNILRLGGYQLDFMHVPKPVTVDLMVEVAKRHVHAGMVGFVNGVLRRWAGGPAVPLPTDPLERLAVEHSHPIWMIERWLPRFGETETEALCSWNNAVPPLDVRINRQRIDAEEFLLICKERDIVAAPSVFPDAFSLESAGAIEKLPGFKEGLFWVQSQAALLPVLLLDPKPGEKILDLCAAPGGKSCQIADQMNDQGEVIAVDIDPERVKRIEENRRRSGLRSIRALNADGRKLAAHGLAYFDAVLVDAPCGATGVLRRNADARWNKRPDDFRQLSATELELLEAGANLVKPGGRLVYSTCSLEPEENREVIERFLASHQGFRIEEETERLPKSLQGLAVREKPFLQTYPQKDQLDGFFVTKLRHD